MPQDAVLVPSDGGMPLVPRQAGAAPGGSRAIVPPAGRQTWRRRAGRQAWRAPVGSMRASRENRRIALVDRQDGDSRGGDTAACLDQGQRGGRRADQSTDGGGPDLSLLEAGVCAVLDFAREGGMLVPGRVAECDSLSLEKRGGPGAAVFKMRAVDGEACGDEELNPEVERALESIESGTFAGRRCTAGEYIEHAKKDVE